MYSLSRNAPNNASVIRSTISSVVRFRFSTGDASPFACTNSKGHTATACPRFMDWCSSRVGMCRTQWQWLNTSFERPHFSEPNRIATGAEESLPRMDLAPFTRSFRGCCNCRWRTAVVPTTMVQSATASATVAKSLAFARTEEAPTADLASLNATSYGFTTRSCVNPKLLIARAAAPILSGFLGATRTTRRSCNFSGLNTAAIYLNKSSKPPESKQSLVLSARRRLQVLLYFAILRKAAAIFFSFLPPASLQLLLELQPAGKSARGKATRSRSPCRSDGRT